MQIEEAMRRLRRHEGRLREFGLTNLYIYGSCARSEANVDSDVDLFSDIDNDRFRSNIQRVALELEDILGVPVDFNRRSGLKEVVRRSAESDARRVF